jgi:hypothetical protein
LGSSNLFRYRQPSRPPVRTPEWRPAFPVARAGGAEKTRSDFSGMEQRFVKEKVLEDRRRPAGSGRQHDQRRGGKRQLVLDRLAGRFHAVSKVPSGSSA